MAFGDAVDGGQIAQPPAAGERLERRSIHGRD